MEEKEENTEQNENIFKILLYKLTKLRNNNKKRFQAYSNVYKRKQNDSNGQKGSMEQMLAFWP
jgi:hypothetical protein